MSSGLSVDPKDNVTCGGSEMIGQQQQTKKNIITQHKKKFSEREQ